MLTPLLNEISEILASPNNILGIEYCKAILRLNSSIKPTTVKRQGNGYHDSSTSDTEFASATAIRQLAANALYKEASFHLPDEAGQILEKELKREAFITENDFDSMLHYCLLKENTASLSGYLDVSPDLAQRIMNQRNSFQSFTQFASLLKTKEVTQTRIQRALLHILLDIREPQTSIPYARILGFRKDSSPLKEIKKNSRVPLVTKLADTHTVLDSEALKLLEKDTFASNLYESVLSRKTNEAFVHEYQKKIVII